MLRTVLTTIVLFATCSVASARPWVAVPVMPAPVVAYYPPAVYPAPVVTYSPVVTAPVVPAPVVVAPAPAVTYYRAPVVATVPSYYYGPTPYVVGRPAVVTQRVYIRGQPVRNALRVLAP